MARTRRRLTVALALALLVGAPLVGTPQDFADEVKAEFLERFTRLIEWPASSSAADPDRPFVIGVVGSGSIVGALERLAESAEIKGKRAEVRVYPNPAAIGSCDAVWVTASAAGRLAEVLARVSRRPVLTLGDSPGLAEQGVMINFVTSGEFIRFEINRAAFSRAHLRVADELLALATVVDAG